MKNTDLEGKTRNEVQMGQLDASLYTKLASDLGITGLLKLIMDKVNKTIFKNFQRSFH